MNFSRPSLHAPVLKLQADKDLVTPRLEAIAIARQRSAGFPAAAPAAAAGIAIPLTTVSLQGNFDAKIHITYPGSTKPAVKLLVDSGNSSLIVPSYSDIAALPNFSTTYAVLKTGASEPWGCPANILRGPIQIPVRGGGVYIIPNSVFYACTGPNASGQLTSNFGTGCLSPWLQKVNGITLQSPLSYDANFPFAEFSYAPAGQVLTAASQPTVDENSVLALYRAMPPGYNTFAIIKECFWMSLVPSTLSIAGAATGWPGARPSIAMIDTGGGPVFLSDPDNHVYGKTWPDPTSNPPWVTSQSVSCQSTYDSIAITIGDANGSFNYTIDTSTLPTAVRGLTLVMCEKCEYMMGQDGMNVGGISALFNDILIDYASTRVGLKPKAAVIA